MNRSDPSTECSERVGDSTVRVGRFTYGTENVTIREWGEGFSLSIGSFCSIAGNVTIFLGGNHRVDWITTFPFGHIFVEELGGIGIEGHPISKGDVAIGNDVWIGDGSVIMSGVTIGDGAVVAASAHVVRDVAPYEIVGGNPARHLKYRFDAEIRDLLYELAWWHLPTQAIRSIAPKLSSAPNSTDLRALIREFKGLHIK